MIGYFKSSFIVAGIGLVLAYLIGGYEALWIAAILSIMEITLSFDNSILNVETLKHMDAKWRHRFITIGMLIAVFGMRMLFPILIVSVTASLSPLDAFNLAVFNPNRYEEIMNSAEMSTMGFGFSFLGMVALKFFIDSEKDDHWIGFIENKLTRLGKIEAIQAVIILIISYVFFKLISNVHDVEEATSFLIASIIGLVSYILVDSIGVIFDLEDASTSVAKSGLSGFLYLELLDASMSFDGTISSFSMTNNFFIICIGLSSGAMVVREMTLMLLDKGTIDNYKYLSHGAYYAIFGLSTIMLLNTITSIPEVITGLIGLSFIGMSLVSSINYNKSQLANN